MFMYPVKVSELFLGVCGTVFPGAGHAALGRFGKGLGINLAWKLWLVLVLWPGLSFPAYLFGLSLFMGGLFARTLITARKASNRPPWYMGCAWLALFVLLDLGGAHLLRRRALAFYRIHDISMEPNLLDGDLVALDRLDTAYTPGDIVIFVHPRQDYNLVKRVAGITGGARELFVLGDNFTHSLDSRKLGYIPQSNVYGRAARIVWSFDKEKQKIRWDRLGKELRPSLYQTAHIKGKGEEKTHVYSN